jgi:hypothetical protein
MLKQQTRKFASAPRDQFSVREKSQRPFQTIAIKLGIGTDAEVGKRIRRVLDLLLRLPGIAPTLLC